MAAGERPSRRPAAARLPSSTARTKPCMASRRSIDYSLFRNNPLHLTGIILELNRPYIAAMNETPDATTNTWHAGEREAQRRASVAEKLAAHGPRVLRP